MPRIKESLSRLERLQAVSVCVSTFCLSAVGAASLIASASLPGAAAGAALPAAAPPVSVGDPAVKPRVVAGYGKLPLAFEPNQGQSAEEVKFLAHGTRYGLFITPTKAVLTLHKPTTGAASPLRRGQAVRRHGSPASARQPKSKTEPPLTLTLRLLGANPHPAMTGLDPLPGKVHYLRGKDPKRWHTDIPTYRKVRYAQVYPGVDLVCYGNPQGLEHDFVVALGADPAICSSASAGVGPCHKRTGRFPPCSAQGCLH